MSFFQLFHFCLGSGLGTIGDLSSEQLLHDPLVMEPCKTLNKIHWYNNSGETSLAVL